MEKASVKKRDSRIDILKGFAVIAIILYHLGGDVLPYGYLGVDIFFVISGYLMMKGMIHQIEKGTFSFWQYIIKRVVRLWPMVLLAGILSLTVGYFVMLPDDFENLSESVVASNLFANNILACITTRDYWDIVNTYKPLMHTWYLGVLMQIYVVLTLIFALVNKVCRGNQKGLKWCAGILTVLSFIAYIMPNVATEWKFYYFPFRLYEMTLGAWLAFGTGQIRSGIGKAGKQHIIEVVSGLAMVLLICVKKDLVLPEVRLISVAVCTSVFIYIFSRSEDRHYAVMEPLACLGRCSLSLYLVHQIVIAFMYYAVIESLNAKGVILFGVAAGILFAAFYYLAERNLDKAAASRSGRRSILAISVITCIISTGTAGIVYLRAGVVRDVPELGISVSDVHRGMHAEYCDIPYGWDRDFERDDKIKILVIGSSYGRDWANVLNESPFSDRLEISYVYPYSNNYIRERENRVVEADYVFCVIGPGGEDISAFLQEVIPSEKLYVVSDKNFGTSNGIIYANRFKDNYFSQSVKIDKSYIENNIRLEEKYGDHFMDLIGAVLTEDGTVRVFTDDNRFISQDCMHLTKYGALYYSRIIDLSFLLNESGVE